jgi:hypothetical protein
MRHALCPLSFGELSLAGKGPISDGNLLKKLQTSSIGLNNLFWIIGDQNIFLDPGRRPAAADHFIDLVADAIPESLAALGIEQYDRNLFQDGELHVTQRYSQFFERTQATDVKNRKGCYFKPFLPAVTAGGLKNLAKIDVGGHGLIGDIQKIRSR